MVIPSVDNHQGERKKHVTANRDLEKKVADLEQQLENIVTLQKSERAGEVPAEDTHIYDQPPEVLLVSYIVHASLYTCTCIFISVSSLYLSCFSIQLLWMSQQSMRMRESPS